MDEILILAIAFNLMLLALGWFSGSRSVVIISSVIWIIIGFFIYQTYPDTEGADYQIKTLLLAISYMMAFAQIFIPLNRRNLTG